MILVFGGTTEGKRTMRLLEKMALPYLYSTKTKVDFNGGKHGRYRYGALNEAMLQELVIQEKISVIIYASHPFAENLMQTVNEVHKLLDIPVWYVEREYENRTSHALVQYVADYKEAIAVLEMLKPNILLALTGVQSIEKLTVFWHKATTYFRILNRPSSLAIAKQGGIHKNHLILGYPSTTLNQERTVIRKYRCDAILTKESGKSGFLPIKIEAAIKEHIPIVIIKRPLPPPSFGLLQSIDQLKVELQKRTALSA